MITLPSPQAVRAGFQVFGGRASTSRCVTLATTIPLVSLIYGDRCPSSPACITAPWADPTVPTSDIIT